MCIHSHLDCLDELEDVYCVEEGGLERPTPAPVLFRFSIRSAPSYPFEFSRVLSGRHGRRGGMDVFAASGCFLD